MKKITYLLIAFVLPLLFSCGGHTGGNENAKISTASDGDLYFDFTLDGKEFHLTEADISTSYNEFSSTDREFKIFAGKEEGPNLLLNMVADMSKPSTTPNGSSESGSKLIQGSVSLQNYPEKGFTFNSYDYLLDPKPAIIPDAIVITKSEKDGDVGRVLTGTIDVIVRGGAGMANNQKTKDYAIKGKFRIRHEFKGLKF